MDIESVLMWTTLIALDILVFAWVGKKLLAKYREMKADGEITLDEVIDAVDDVVDLAKEAKEKLEENHDGQR